jgi:hypothetical protein
MIQAESAVYPTGNALASRDERLHNALDYWGLLPFRLIRQAMRNGHDICRVLDLIRFNPLQPGAVDLDHPWCTGISPHTGKLIWHDNVIYSTPRREGQPELPSDDEILIATGRFMASRVRKSAATPELPVGPKRRMPHAINYMHGSSHYNSGIILLNDLEEGFRHITSFSFRRDLRAFVKQERREVLFIFRDPEYDPRVYAHLSCCMRTHFHWFCNPNGPKARVLWGNLAPFAAANLITGHWADDVYALREPDGATKVTRPPICQGKYLQAGPYHGEREYAIWPEKTLARINDLRIRLRGQKSGMFFVDRRKVYADQIKARTEKGESHEYRSNV